MPITVNAAKTDVDFVSNNAAKTQADAVKVNAAKTVAYLKSDPQTHTADVFDTSTVYRGVSGVISNRPDVRNFAYYGFQWNSEIERTQVRMSTAEHDALRDALIARPVISQIEIFLWTQHTQASSPADLWLGWHGNAAEVANFARLHTEKDAAWASGLLSMPTNTVGGGNQTSFIMPSSIHATLSAQIQAGNIWGITTTDEDANGTSQWGWMAGDKYCTNESGGSCIGSDVPITGSDAQRVRIAVTSDFS